MHALPFKCLRPAPDKAASFAAPPYDVFDRAQAKAYVKDHPDSFLAIDCPDTAFPDGHDMYADDVYTKARELYLDCVQNGTLIADNATCYYIYQLIRNGHQQTGIVAACAVDDYLDGTIKRHESTRPEKEQDRIRHIEALDAQTGPVFLAYRDEPVLDVILKGAMSGQPLYDFTDDEGVRQIVWRVARKDATDAIEAMLERVPNAYIADGHHRAASAIKVSQHKREQHPDASPNAPYNYFLAVLFPSNQLNILPYDRVVKDTNGLSTKEFLSKANAAGFATVSGPSSEPASLAQRHDFGVYVSGSWYTLRYQPTEAEEHDPVKRLDCSILQDRLLGPILGIRNAREDPRISFVGGIEGTKELASAAGENGIAFSMFPTSMDEVMAAADAGKLMPPKSTWFEPKLRSGLFIRPLGAVSTKH